MLVRRSWLSVAFGFALGVGALAGFGALSAAPAGAIAGPQPPRLSGNYAVQERVSAQSLPPRDADWPIGDIFTPTWDFVPQCVSGTCDIDLTSSDGIVKARLSPAGPSSYAGTFQGAPANCQFPNGGKTVSGAYTVSGDVKVTASSPSAFTGALTERWAPTSIGLKGGCAFDIVTLQLTSPVPSAAPTPPTPPILSNGGCKPSISAVSTFEPGPAPHLVVEGTCFGTGGAFTATTSPDFRVSFFPPTATLAQMQSAVAGTTTDMNHWNACSNRADALDFDAPDQVGCTVADWSPSRLTLVAFGPNYGGSWTSHAGDKVVVQVWNANSFTGPAGYFLTVGVPGSLSANPEVGSIAASLPTPAEAFRPLSSDIVNAAITVGLALFITFPANLFNSTFSENYADIMAWWEKWAALLLPPPLRVAAAKASRRGLKALLDSLKLSGRSRRKKLEREQAEFAAVVLSGALLGSLLDPSFGFNFRTVLSYVAIVVAMVAGVVISGIVTHGYHRARKHGRVPYKLHALPLGLAVAAVCVFISRVTGFQPGYLYGVIAGVTFGRDLARHEEGHVVALDAWARVGLAIVAWVAWAALTHDANHPGSFFGTVLLDDFLASLFLSSLVSTVISLFPLKFLPGHKLQAWHKGAWAATFLVTLFVLVQVLLRPHSTASGPSHGPLVMTIVLFGLFGGGSVLFRDHFARKHRRLAAAAAEGTADADAGVGESASASGTIDLGQVAEPAKQGEVVSSGDAGPAPEHP